VLASIGWTEARIDALARAGVIKQAERPATDLAGRPAP
jgi:hypothetical protein